MQPSTVPEPSSPGLKAGLSPPSCPGTPVRAPCWGTQTSPYSPAAPHRPPVLGGLRRRLLLLGWKRAGGESGAGGQGTDPARGGTARRGLRASQPSSPRSFSLLPPTFFPPPWPPRRLPAAVTRQEGAGGRHTPGQGTHARCHQPGHPKSAGSPGTQRGPCRGRRAASAPSDFSNCSSRLDRSVASIPGPGERAQVRRATTLPAPSFPGKLRAGATAPEPAAALPCASRSRDRSARLRSPGRDQFGRSEPRPQATTWETLPNTAGRAHGHNFAALTPPKPPGSIGWNRSRCPRLPAAPQPGRFGAARPPAARAHRSR